MTTTAPSNAPARLFAWFLWVIAGAGLGWLIGFCGFLIHVAVYIPSSISMLPGGGALDPAGGGALDANVVLTVQVLVYSWTAHEETGPLQEVYPRCKRLAQLIGWPTLAVCIALGAAGGAYLRRVMQARAQSQEPSRASGDVAGRTNG
jgi:hypothetical protein